MFTTENTSSEATQRVIAVKHTRLTHKIVIQLHLVAESCTICSCRSMWPVQKLLVKPSYFLRVDHAVYHSGNMFDLYFGSVLIDTEPTGASSVSCGTTYKLD